MYIDVNVLFENLWENYLLVMFLVVKVYELLGFI